MISPVTGKMSIANGLSQARRAEPDAQSPPAATFADNLTRAAAADRTEETAAKLLSQLFFAPLLAEARKNPFGAKFANGGRTEAIFGEQLDIRVADAVAGSGAGGVTAQIAKQLTSRGGRGVPA